MSVPVLEFDRFEADDVIGTIARRAPSRASTSSLFRAIKTCCNW